MTTKKLFITLIASVLATGGVYAKPALKGLRTYIQPDGTEIKINIVGDEHFHYATTEDGKLIQIDDDGYYRIASIANDGAILSTGISINSTDAVSKVVYAKDIDMAKLKEMRLSKKKTVAQNGLGRTSTTYPTIGSPKGLIILVEYEDLKFKTTNNYTGKEYFNNMINGENFTEFGGTGSALQYFIEQSGGKFVPQFDVLGPVQLPHTQYYYGHNNRYGDDENAHLMVTDAIAILDPDIDFSQYDNDNDGIIDNVYIFYAGQGEADYGGVNTVWPHSWDVRYGGVNKKADGKTIATYACSNEWDRNSPTGVGTFIHEFSHVMGLPDLYHTTNGYATYTPDAYSVLDYGPYNNDGRTPPNYGAYEKNALGWYQPIMLNGQYSVSLPDISTGQFGLIPTENENEFFLFENRQQTGWDKYIPSHGMLIWHIDYVEKVFHANEVNNTEKHQYVDLVEANNRQDNKYSKGYTFPGSSNNTSFTATTTPAFVDWKGNAIDYPITDIVESDGIISFNVAGGGKSPSEAAVEIIPETEDAPIYFNLQGVRVNNPVKGTIVIEKRGNNIRKIKI